MKPTPNRRGVFVGGYLKPKIAEYLKARATAEHKTVTVVLEEIIKRDMMRTNEWNSTMHPQGGFSSK